MSKPKRLSWKPILRGNIYCAPACGGSCTKAQHDRQKKIGERIAACLGKGWTVELHENMRWYVTVVSPCQRIRVCPDQRTRDGKIFSYWAMICDAGEIGIRYLAHASTPAKAIEKAKMAARKDLAKIGADLVSLLA